MKLWMWILLAWLAFNAVVYVAMWFDVMYYRNHLASKFRMLLASMTEEE